MVARMTHLEGAKTVLCGPGTLGYVYLFSPVGSDPASPSAKR